jgi:hypothetical protein
MKYDEAYKIIVELDDSPPYYNILQDTVDIWFPDCHSIYHYMSEGGTECGLEELCGELETDEMPDGFEELLEAWKKYGPLEQWDKIEEIKEKLIEQNK